MLVVELPRPNSHAKVRASFFEPIHLPSRDLEDVPEDPDEQASIDRDLAGKDRDGRRRVAATPGTDEDGSETPPALSLLCFLCASGIPGGGNLVPPSPVLFQASSPFSSFFYGQGHQSHELANESTKTDVVWSTWPWFVGAIDVDGDLNPGDQARRLQLCSHQGEDMEKVPNETVCGYFVYQGEDGILLYWSCNAPIPVAN